MPTQNMNKLGNDMISKYNFLLQPIRDLTKNWDIDVAAQLEEYLNEIEKIQISFDGGKTTMNFAEAALLIQGSACIYSKKVEYLYTLVYQTLDLIASKKRLQQAASVDDKDPDNETSLGQEDEFLCLDDIQEAKNIDLKDDDNKSKNEASQIIPRTPLALIPLGERDRQDMLLSHTGEVLGSRNDFKMNTCTVHASGALLLDLGNLTLADSSFKRLPTSTPQPTSLEKEASENQQDHQPQDEPADNQLAIPDANMYNDGDDCYDDDAVGDAEEMYQEDVCEVFNQEEQEPERMELRKRDKQQQQQQYQRQKLQVEDSWELLDPHDPGKHDEKPFRKGRPFKLPTSLMEISKNNNKKKRKRNETMEKKPVLIPLQEFCTMAFHSHASKFPKNPLKAPVYKEFEYLYWVEFRRRQELEKKQKKMLAEYLTQDQIEDLDAVVPEYRPENEEQEGDVPMYVGPDGNDDYDDDDNNFGVPDNMPDNDQLTAPEEPQEELVVSGYEDLVRRYVEGYLLEAQHYAKETDLSRRVKEWENRIVPTLEIEETHRPFDIHQYGSEILGTFQEKEILPFAEMMKDKQPYEICRYFLATLQLANNYNVEVSSADDTMERIDTMKLKLLHKTPAHDAIQSYRAPSIMT